MPDLPADAWPVGDRITWGDDVARIHHDFLDETTRPYTAAENTEADARGEVVLQKRNGEQLRTAATDALAANRLFLALTAPTNAQTLNHVRDITRQMNAVIRLAVNDLSGTD